MEQDPSLRLAATWIPGASAPSVVHGANTSIAVEGVVAGVVVVGGAVVVLTAPTGGCVVMVVGSDVPDACGSLVVVDVVPPGNCGSVEMVVGAVAAALK